jgi:hypothetical protein
MQFYRGPDYDVSKEFNEIRRKHQSKIENVTKSWKGTLKRMASMAFLKPFSCIGILYLLGTWNGFNVIINYMITIIKESGSSIDPEICPIIVGSIRVLTAGLSSLLMYRVSPKILFVICQLISGTGMASIGLYAYLKSHHPDLPYLDDFGWIPLVMVITVVVMRAAGILPVMHVLSGELYPTDIRTQAIGVQMSVFLAFGAAGVKIFPDMLNTIGFHGSCIVYTTVTLAIAIWGAITIPDNRGISLVKVEEHYENETPELDVAKEKTSESCTEKVSV